MPKISWALRSGVVAFAASLLGGCGSHGGEAPEASCVENYSPAAAVERAFAFDGTIVAVGPSVTDRGDDADLGLPGVTFEVEQWFTPGRAATVTVDLPESYGVGTRLLVSGEPRWAGRRFEAPLAWDCGFTRPHDTATAEAWASAAQR